MTPQWHGFNPRIGALARVKTRATDQYFIMCKGLDRLVLSGFFQVDRGAVLRLIDLEIECRPLVGLQRFHGVELASPTPCGISAAAALGQGIA